MKFSVRDFTKKDRKIYLTLAEEFVNSSAVLHSVPRCLLEQNFDNILQEQCYCRGVILESDLTPCGYAIISFSYSTEVAGKLLWIEELYISPEYQRNGIGHMFFDWLFSEYKGIMKRFRLETTAQNDLARKLYREIGFENLEYRQMCLDFAEKER